MTGRPNLLMINYFHPPAATGVRRSVSLIRHLPDFGWRPVVLSCRATAGEGHDETPLADPRVRRAPVVRTGSLDPYRLARWWRGTDSRGGNAVAASATGASSRARAAMEWLRRNLFIPDDRMGWIPFAVWTGIWLVRRHRLRAIYSSSYPNSAHLVALAVHLATGVPWLADFRDGWTQNPAFFRPGNPLIAGGQRLLERVVARRATRIVTVSPPITRHLQRLRGTGRIPATTIFNGFDPGDFAVAAGSNAGPLNPGKLTLLYTGTFFGRRSPVPFLKAVRELLRTDPVWRDGLRVRLRAVLDPRHSALIRRLGLDDVVQVLPPVSFAECLVEQRRADACLLVLEGGPGSDIMVSQKVFEYLAARRPVFAQIPEGAAAELLREVGGACLSVGDSARECADRLAGFLSAVRSGDFSLPPESVLQQFHRRLQAGEVARLLDGMARAENNKGD